MKYQFPLTDFNDVTSIIEREEKEKKDFFFNFIYNNSEKLKKNKLALRKKKARRIVSNRPDYDLPDNRIRTNKYTSINFIPKNLIEQFAKKANLYFLVLWAEFIGIMQTIPDISISNGLPAIYVPLIFVLIVSALKDFYEDFKRKKSDNEENNKTVLVYEGGKFRKTFWKNLRVGNIVKIFQNEPVPADLVMVYSSEMKGVCFVETKSLDGESNLKIKYLQKDLQKIFKDLDFNENKVVFEYEPTNPYLFSFSGAFMIEDEIKFPIDLCNFILRGSSIKNTEFICGFVVYTGHETKIMMNSFKTKGKKSDLENIMSYQILLVLILQILTCTFCSIIYLVWYSSNQDSLSYLSINKNRIEDHNSFYNFFVRIGNWMLIFTNFVPISLLVTLETVKFFQGIHMQKDSQLASNYENSQISVNSSNLNEELGQIEYLFSDKTGTLTCNKMDFRCISINGKAYGLVDEKDPLYIKDYSSFPKVTNVNFRDRGMFDTLNEGDSYEANKIINVLFFLALCHTVVAEYKENEIIYNAASPDELALVNFAKFCGYEFKGIEENSLIVETKEKKNKFKLLHVFDFNSTRKRQSVILEDENEQIMLLCKGADSVLETLVTSSNPSLFDNTWISLEIFGNIGLRTLVLAQKRISQKDYRVWNAAYENAKNMMENRLENMNKLQEEMEKDLVLLGATAIEDKLQEGVEETIHALKMAGIKIWVLTGDKVETALNVGFACGLLNNNMERIVIEDKLEIQIEEQFKKASEKLNRISTNENALIIHGQSLIHALLKPFLREKLIEICKKCLAVMCCRVSPKQKQEVVTLMKSQFPKCSTLAIGDGANDVNMINAAHVGVGIKGLEGQQAARASDYAISEFRFLRRLLFYHGRECYRRNSNLVCYNFFKNIILVLPQFFYGFFNYFSGQSLYESFIYQLFNLVYTSFPIMIYAIFDQEFNDKILMNNHLNYYLQGIRKKLFNTRVFWNGFLIALAQALIILFWSFFSVIRNFINIDGFMLDFWHGGTMVYGLCLVVSNLKILVISNTFSFISCFFVFFSLFLYFVSILIIDVYKDSELYGVLKPIFTTANIHLGNILTIFCCTFLDFALLMKNKFRKRTQLIELSEEYKELCQINQNQQMAFPVSKDDVGKYSKKFTDIRMSRLMERRGTNYTAQNRKNILEERLKNSKETSITPKNSIIFNIQGDIVHDMAHLGFAFSHDETMEFKQQDII